MPTWPGIAGSGTSPCSPVPADAVTRRPAAGAGRRALVTGGAGFVGSHLVDALIELRESGESVEHLRFE